MPATYFSRASLLSVHLVDDNHPSAFLHPLNDEAGQAPRPTCDGLIDDWGEQGISEYYRLLEPSPLRAEEELAKAPEWSCLPILATFGDWRTDKNLLVVFEKGRDSPVGAVLLEGRADWIRDRLQETEDLLLKVLPLVPVLGSREEFFDRRVVYSDNYLRFLDVPAKKTSALCDNSMAAFRSLRAEYYRRIAALYFTFIGLAKLSLAAGDDQFQQARNAIDSGSPLKESFDLDAKHFADMARQVRGVYLTRDTPQDLADLFVNLEIPVWGAVELSEAARTQVEGRILRWAHPLRQQLHRRVDLEIPTLVQRFFRDTRSTSSEGARGRLRSDADWRTWMSHHAEIDLVEEGLFPPQSVTIDPPSERAPSSAPTGGEPERSVGPPLEIPAAGPPLGQPTKTSASGLLIFRCPASGRLYLYHPNVPAYSGWVAKEKEGVYQVEPSTQEGRVRVHVRDTFVDAEVVASTPTSTTGSRGSRSVSTSGSSASVDPPLSVRPALPALQTSYGPSPGSQRLRRRTPSDTGATVPPPTASSSSSSSRDRSTPAPAARADELREVLFKRARHR